MYELEKDKVNVRYELRNTSHEAQRVIAYGGVIGFPCDPQVLLKKPNPVENEDYAVIMLKPGDILTNSCGMDLVNEIKAPPYHYSLGVYGWKLDVAAIALGQYALTVFYVVDGFTVPSNTITFNVEKNHITQREALEIAQDKVRESQNMDDFYIKSIEERNIKGEKHWFITFDPKQKLQQKSQGVPITVGGEIFVQIDQRDGEAVLTTGE